MKRFLAVFLTILNFTLFAHAHEGNYGKLVSKGTDCGVIDVYYAYFSLATGEKSVVLLASIADYSYEKVIYVQNVGVNQTALAGWDSSQGPVAAYFIGMSDAGRANIRITDKVDGPELDYTFNLYVQMNGKEYSCSNIRVGM